MGERFDGKRRAGAGKENAAEAQKVEVDDATLATVGVVLNALCPTLGPTQVFSSDGLGNAFVGWNEAFVFVYGDAKRPQAVLALDERGRTFWSGPRGGSLSDDLRAAVSRLPAIKAKRLL